MRQTTVEPVELRHPVPRVGVVIVTWNKKDFVLRLLDDLAARPYPNWSVLVVDNCSSDGTLEAVVARHPWTKTVRTESNLGGSGGFNTGLKAMLAEGGFDYVWLLDNDVALDPGALEVLVETLESRPDAGVAGSHMIQMDRDSITNEIGGDVDLEGGRLLLLQHESFAQTHRAEVYEVDYVAACSLLVRYDVLRQVGIWDDFFVHYDDVDWCLRIRAAGYRVLACAASRIRHMSARTKPLTWMYYYDIRNVLYLKWKHLEFHPLHHLYFLCFFLYYCMRDELSGKGYYGRLVELAIRDFLDGRMGRCERLPLLALKPARAVLDAALAGKAGTILVLEPARKTIYDAGDLAAAAARQVRIIGICHELATRPTALPAQAPRIRLSRLRPIMAAQLLKMAFLRRPADCLILDVDQPCGLLGLCARQIVLLADDKCTVERGGMFRLLVALKWPFRWLALLVRFMLFVLLQRRRRPGILAQAAGILGCARPLK